MPDTRSCTYEDLYYEMWEISQRYSQIAQFRVIGKSHDERMMDAWYAKNVSFFLDVKIFFKTIETVLHPDRVYKNK